MEISSEYISGYNKALQNIVTLLKDNTKLTNEELYDFCIKKQMNNVNAYCNINNIFHIDNVSYENKMIAIKQLNLFFKKNGLKSIIYIWYNKKTYKLYVGSTTNPKTRFLDFINPNVKKYAGNKINEIRYIYSPKDWIYYIIDISDKVGQELINLENHYIKLYNSIENGYNTEYAKFVPNFTSLKIKGTNDYKVQYVMRSINNFLNKNILNNPINNVNENNLSNFININEKENYILDFICKWYCNGKLNTISNDDIIYMPKKIHKFFSSFLNICDFSNDKQYPTTLVYKYKNNTFRPISESINSYKPSSLKEAVNYEIGKKYKKFLNVTNVQTPYKETNLILSKLHSFTIKEFIQFKYNNHKQLLDFLKTL